MKTRLLTCLFCFAVCLAPLSFTGCATTGGASTPAQNAATVRALTSTGASLALAKNPRYTAAAKALAEGLSGALDPQAVITPGSIAAFVRATCERHSVPVEDVPVFVSLAVNCYQLAEARYGSQLRVSDPRVVPYLAAFRDGLNDALAALPKSG